MLLFDSVIDYSDSRRSNHSFMMYVIHTVINVIEGSEIFFVSLHIRDLVERRDRKIEGYIRRTEILFVDEA